MIRFLWIVTFLGICQPIQAQDVVLGSDPSLEESGVWRYVLPRFRLKTRINVVVVYGDPDITGDVLVLPGGAEPLMRDAQGQTFGLTVNSNAANVVRFADWLGSEIGRNTLSAFAIDGQQVFFPLAEEQGTAEIALTGNVARGEQTSLRKCGRCHVVSAANRYGGIDSTPSFRALRALADWQEKFLLFYVLNPHPSFTQIKDVTPPFDPAFPPVIYPIFLTLEEVENIGAYMQSLEPLDLGPPLLER